MRGVKSGWTLALLLLSAPAWAAKGSMRDPLAGVTVQAGGGVEGYTGAFASQLNPGVGWTVTADVNPLSMLGFELGYSGAANDLDHGRFGSQGAVDGADVVRNGGHVAAMIGLPTMLQPYVLGGLGIDRYHFRGVAGQDGFQSDTSGSIPLAVGIRAHPGALSADLRLGYDLLFADQFSPVRTGNVGDGRYTGTLQLGGKF